MEYNFNYINYAYTDRLTRHLATIIRAKSREARAAPLCALSVPATQARAPKGGQNVLVFPPPANILYHPPLTLILQEGHGGCYPGLIIL